jgi:ATP-dependent DNA helicase RecQ
MIEPEGLLARFGFDAFRPGQRAVIDALDAHGRALAVFPTGGGKSICYQLPALAWEGLTVVISPLIALMKDQIDFLRARDVPAARLDSSLGDAELRATMDAIDAGRLRILYVAPERFQNERFLQMLARTRIALFAVDEAHCISEWGHSFRPDYLKLADTARAVSAERVLALTATATPEVVADVCAAFGIPREAAIVTGFYRHNLEISIRPAADRERDGVLVEQLRARPPGPAIVYVTLQKTAERVAVALRSAGLPAEAYHAGMEADVRTAVQERWKAGDRGIVVATIAFGMGIDKSDVRYVYHYNLPKSLESYSQEIGRAGRDDRPSIVEVLACADDVPMLENFAHGDTPTDGSVRGLVEDLAARPPGAVFDVSFTELADRHDMRPLVVRTAVTYLELLGVVRMNGPFYAGYRLRPLAPEATIVEAFRGEHAAFVRDLFRHSKKARVWYTVDPARLAAVMGQERSRVIRALEVLEERGHVELAASDVRHRYTRGEDEVDLAALAGTLGARFAHREQQEIARIAKVLAWIGESACHTNALVAHFGEERAEPCGHCTGCRVGPVRMPGRRSTFAAPAADVAAELAALRAAHPDALREPRQIARLLCGLTSPSLTRAKLSRHRLFGHLAEHRFADVMAWSCRA